MIREVVLARRMPPWHADRHYGKFINDRSLTPAETRTLLSGSSKAHLEATVKLTRSLRLPAALPRRGQFQVAARQA